MNTLSSTTSLFTHALSWALIHSLWQGMLIYAVLFVLLKSLPGASARTKYYLSFIAFTSVFLWFADTSISQYQKLKGTIVYISQAGTDNANPTTYAVKAIPGGDIQSPFLHNFLSKMEQYFPLIMLIYTIGLSFMMFRFVVNAIQARALRQQGIVHPAQEWDDLLVKWKAQLGISRPVKLLLSTHINIPMMIGAIKPIILLPIATVNNLSTDQVEAILMHELAHIKRHDYLLNLIQTIGETILFFNPFVWLISSVIRKERELCCDDVVVESAASPLSYAKALLALENHRILDNNLALAATGNKNQLFHRIKRIMEMKKKNLDYSQLTIIVVAIIAVTFTAAMFTFTPSMAQKPQKDNGDTTQVKASYKYKVVTIDGQGNKTEKEITSNKPLSAEEVQSGHAQPREPQEPQEPVASASARQNNSYAYSYSYNDGDSLKKIMNDVTIIIKNATDAVAKIDMEEINKQMDKARAEIKAVDWDKIQREINKAMADVDEEINDPKLRRELKEEIGQKMQDARKQMEGAREQMERAKEQMNETRISIEENRTGGSHEAWNDRPNSVTDGYHTNFNAMLDEMEKDGLIDRSDYKIKKEGDELYIDGKRQPASVYEKYHRYLREKNLVLKGKGDAISITISDE